MAELTPSVAYGRSLILNPPARAWNDAGDKKSGGAYSHDPRELSAQALYELSSMLLALVDLAQSGAFGVAVIHDEAETLAAGTLVRVTTYDDTNGAYHVTPAQADAAGTLAALALAADLAPDTVGQAYAVGVVGDLDTSGAAAVGAVAYLSGDTAGALAWSAGDYPQPVGIVTYKDATAGEVAFALPGLSPWRNILSALADVDLSGLADGDMLIWNATAKMFQPTAPTDTDEKVAANADDETPGYLADKVDNATIIVNEGDKIQVGTIGDAQFDEEDPLDWSKVDTTDAEPADVGAAAASHEHAATDLTSGNLAVARAWLESLVELTGNPTLDSTAHAKTYYNGTSTRKDPTLPDAVAGLRIRFMVLHSDGIRITAASGDRIRYGNDVTTADTGYVQSGSNNGHVIELVAVDSTNWVVVGAVGTWTLTAS